MATDLDIRKRKLWQTTKNDRQSCKKKLLEKAINYRRKKIHCYQKKKTKL